MTVEIDLTAEQEAALVAYASAHGIQGGARGALNQGVRAMVRQALRNHGSRALQIRQLEQEIASGSSVTVRTRP